MNKNKGWKMSIRVDFSLIVWKNNSTCNKKWEFKLIIK